MNRKSFIITSLLGIVPIIVLPKTLSVLVPEDKEYFTHGIASGDPSSEAVIIWTRINEKSSSEFLVNWEISTDENFKNITKSGSFSTSEKRDFTVKVDVKGLKENTDYFYRFNYKGKFSETGNCKTLPLEIDSRKSLQMAVVSCNNYEDGYFSSYRHIGENKNIDYVFHLGDYIYEYATGKYCNPKFLEDTDRKNEPRHEIVTLTDYRQRYALYRRDKDLQKAHQKKSFFCIWDDHELANNAYTDGAKNHQADEGDWYNRSSAAMQAYFEWMPVRANSLKEMIRTIEIGNDAKFYFLEERMDGRDKQLKNSDPEKENKDRKMISERQFQALKSGLEKSETRWNFLVNQVMFTGYDNGKDKEEKEDDWWTGYSHQRNQLIDVFKGLKNPPVILTGDHHQSHVLELKDSNKRKDIIAWEFLTPSITSKNDDRLTEDKILSKRKKLYKLNPHLIFNDTSAHGYFILKIKKEEIDISYRFSENILVKDSPEIQGPQFVINHQNQLIKNV